MRAITMTLAILTGCTGNTFNQGSEPISSDDTGDTTADDTGDTVPSDCTNAWHPVNETGWSKTFTASYEGSTGTATEVGLGPVESPDGEFYYQYQDTISNSGGEGYDVTVTVACDLGGGTGRALV